MVNWFWWVLLLLMGLVLFGTAPVADVQVATSSTVSTTTAPTLVEINGNPGVVLDVSTYSSDLGGWTPSEEDIQAAEDAILDVAPSHDRFPVLQGYRQYVGIVDEDGDRKIIVNSMCSEFEGWDETYIDVMDGGSCFWNATYNVESGELEDLIVNGEA